MNDAILLFGLCFGFVAVLMPLAARVAVALGFVDAPGGRKTHDVAVPPIGGLLIIPVFLVAHYLTQMDWARDWPLYSGVLALLIVGAIDDRFQIAAWPKFAVQIAVSVLVVVYGVCRIDNLGDMFGYGDLQLGFMAVPFSIAAVALLVNAINLMDGVDGLAGGQVFVILVGMVLVGGLSDQMGFVMQILPLSGALLGFLVHNMRSPVCARARVFLGDAGTLSLGLCVAWFVISAANNPLVQIEAINVAWFLALPIMDECAQFYRRVREGRHPFSPDRGHFHHYVLDAGYKPDHATPLILVFSAALGFGALGLHYIGVPNAVLTWGWIVTILTHMALTAHVKGFFTRLLKCVKPTV